MLLNCILLSKYKREKKIETINIFNGTYEFE